MVETDHHVGRVSDYLEKSGLDANTMIFFSSDNGPERSWVERIEEFDHDSSGIYKEGKRSIYEGGHRVPFFVRWPGGIKEPGRSWDGLVGQIDLLSTVAEMIGAKLPGYAGEDSQSFYSVLRKAKSSHNRLPLLNHAIGGRLSITEGSWKLIMPHEKLGYELYNLARDPGEESNVFDGNPEIAKRLEKKITQIVCRGRTTKGRPQSNDTGYWDDLAWLTEAEYNKSATKN
jgi:arylsulfatase A